jgi:translation initiation factor 2 subunit 2
MKYEDLLKKAYKELPKTEVSVDRFEIPKVQGMVQGNKTIINNFAKIVQTFRRDPSHLLKYLLRELASSGNIDGQRLILNRKINSSLINQKIEQYAKDFVICKECGKPDTVIKKEDRFSQIKCQACGAKYTIKSKI